MPAPIQVYYDGGCPVCSREIRFYKARPGSDSMTWVDVNASASPDLGPGLNREAAMARMHVRRSDGRLLGGAAAFGELWRHTPGLKGLGWLLAMPPFETLAELGYRIFLLTRKLWR